MFGLAFLGNALAGLIGGILAWLGQAAVKRIAVIAAVTAAVAALTTVAVGEIITRLGDYASTTALPEWLAPALAWLPSNTASCFSVIVVMESVLWGYRFAVRFVFARTSL